ncbi:DUF1450 domain-containing protein [Paenibacillus sp. GCM10027626]|uniref:DUF1450 domain-containing protein n=1 Tax=Paenibacillus sp. GCM10027626 TaxID=3273411 RepID=UPI0036333CD1
MLPPGLIIVEVCQRNAINSAELEQFEQDMPEVTVMRMECLNHCTLCTVQPHLQVNGKLITARTAKQCFERAGQAIEKEVAFFTGEK